MSYVLFLSNGIGEDTIATGVVRALRHLRPELDIRAFPMVGPGTAYQHIDTPVVGPLAHMPSGGMIPEGFTHLWRDLKAGLATSVIRQARWLAAERARIAMVVGVGDAIPAAMGGLFARRPVSLVGTARSNYFVPYSSVEMALFRKTCRVVFTRDGETARTLQRSGVAAEYVGNAMMDCVDGFGVDLEWSGIPIGVFPGSREAAYRDFPVIAQAMERLGAEFCAAVALADSIELSRLAVDGWELRPRQATRGIVATMHHPNGVRMVLCRAALGSLLESCKAVIGQAGTANEQAAGYGRPLVAFDRPGNSGSLGWYRGRQKGLLGEAMVVVPRHACAIADTLKDILGDAERYEAMRQAGLARMGGPGASHRMAERIARELTSM